jgi:hypothetical protein
MGGGAEGRAGGRADGRKAAIRKERHIEAWVLKRRLAQVAKKTSGARDVLAGQRHVS